MANIPQGVRVAFVYGTRFGNYGMYLGFFMPERGGILFRTTTQDNSLTDITAVDKVNDPFSSADDIRKYLEEETKSLPIRAKAIGVRNLIMNPEVVKLVYNSDSTSEELTDYLSRMSR